MSQTKTLKPGDRLTIPMTMMDSAKTANVEALQMALTDAQVAYQADMNGSTLNDLQAAERALTEAKAADASTVTDTGLSDDYLEGARAGMAMDQASAWRG